MPTSHLSLDDILRAQDRLAGVVRRTPTRQAERLSAILGMEIWLKHDHLQHTRAFKERGARNALALLSSSQRRRGVVAASAGNHALGLAYHGGLLSIPVTVVVPRSAPQVKLDRCLALGAQVVLVDGGFDAAAAKASQLAVENGWELVHPFDDMGVAAGQGTLAVELIEDVGTLDAVVVPVGGGGLLAGTVTALKALRPGLKIVAVEPIHAPSLTTALAAGRAVCSPVHASLADGLSVAKVSERAVTIARTHVDLVVTVSEDEIAEGLWQLHHAEGITVEGAAATGVAAALSGRLAVLGVRRVACLLTGANIDPLTHARVLASVDVRRRHAA